MNTNQKTDWNVIPNSQESLESPFLMENLFAGEVDAEWEGRLGALEAESPFLQGFGADHLFLIQADDEDSVSSWETDAPQVYVSESDEVNLLEQDGSLEEVYVENEASYLEERAKEQNPLPRMKFELQTENRIWRNDGISPSSLLPRKYGSDDFLVNMAKHGVRLESETDGVLEFETEWFRKWEKLQSAIEQAIQMTQAMDIAPQARFDKSRKAFPFAVPHLRIGAKGAQVRNGLLVQKPGREGKNEKALGKNEELEVEITDNGKWTAAIQSSESFLLHLFESYLSDHEEHGLVQSVLNKTRDVLEAVRPHNIPETHLENLRNFILIIVYYIRQGQNIVLHNDPPKFAFRLMSRTSFSSIYKQLLSVEQKTLFTKIVRDDVIFDKMQLNLNRMSPFFINGYANNPKAGPTIYRWLVSIIEGRDQLSDQFNKRLSDAMGKDNVETRKGKTDRWFIKFETRDTEHGRVVDAKDWVSYALKMYKLASKRRRQPAAWVLAPFGSNAYSFLDFIAKGAVNDAVVFARQQGINDENKLTDLVFHSLHPELGGRSVEKQEKYLRKKWLQLRDSLIRPLLQPATINEITPIGLEQFLDIAGSNAIEVDFVNHDIEDSGFEENEFNEEFDALDWEEEYDETDEVEEYREVDPILTDIAERVAAQETPLLEHEKLTRWTKCFSTADIAAVEKVYEENTVAANSNETNRCSCIVMLNVALGQLLNLPLKKRRARSKSNRYVQMANLTTECIERALKQLRYRGYATAPSVINFFDEKGRKAGTLKPENLMSSVQSRVIELSDTPGCWFAFALSIMDGHHSVLLLVDNTDVNTRIYWRDQFSVRAADDVTSSLDERITEITQLYWQAVMDKKKVGYNTMIRLWPLQKRKLNIT